VHERGLGKRLDTYRHEPRELFDSVRQLVSDGLLRARQKVIAERLHASPGTVKAADAIEQVASGEIAPVPTEMAAAQRS
jgi:UDP:flavonoid glycosyltransferase YjiC (YdhE family)